MNHEPALLKSKDGEPMLLEGVSARGLARGLVFELTVEQRYRNPAASNVEVVYTFPLPYEAVLLDLEVEIAGRTLAAAVVAKQEAEARYEEAIDQGDSAIMLERAGDGLCTLNLGNLMAGETAVIRYRYAQLLRFEHGSVRLAIPTVIAPRYGDAQAAGLAPHQVPATDLGASYPFTLVLDLEGEIAAGRLASPSHPVDIAAIDRGVRVTLARGAFLDRDFVLNVDGLAGRSLATVARDGDGFVALASFCAEIPKDSRPLPLTLKLLVDCSGSMAGDSIDAARRALHRVLMGLDAGDRFALTRFGSQAVHETRGLVKADAGAVRAAAERLGAMQANLGGTEMAGALREVFALAGAEASDVIAITDGEVWDADGLVAAARQARQRVFVVGIGSAPAEGVLKRLAEATGGACEFVAPNEDVEGAILRTFARLRAPRIDRVAIAWPAPPQWEAPLPSALFGGETIHALAGFAAAPAGEATLALVAHRTTLRADALRGMFALEPAQRAHGDAPPLHANARFAGIPAQDDTLARVAAARRLAMLDAASQRDLALRYRLLTEHTNLLVVAERAEGGKAKDLPKLAQVAQMHAAGWHGVGSVACRDLWVDLKSTPRAWQSSGVQFCDLGVPYNARHGETRSLDHIDFPAEHDAIAALFADGLPEAWRPVLDGLLAEGFDEHAIVLALLGVLAAKVRREGGRLPRHVDRHLRRLAGEAIDARLRARLEAVAADRHGPAPAETAAWLRRRVDTALAV